MSTTVEDGLHTKLNGTAAITDVVGTRIYQRWLKPNDTLPAIAFYFSSATPVDGSSCDNTTWTYEIQVDIYAESLRATRALADIVSATLRGWHASDPVTGPWCLDQERGDTDNPDNGESFTGGKIIQDYSVSFSK